MSLDIQDEDHSMKLLKTIVEEWVKLHGFAVTSLWLEDYKRSTQETIKAKKGFVTDDFFAMEKAPFPTRVLTGRTPDMSLQLGCHTNHH